MVSNINFVGNMATGDGGAAVLVRDSNNNATLINVHFTFNVAGQHGGAMAATSSNADMKLINCVFKDNSAVLGGSFGGNSL